MDLEERVDNMSIMLAKHDERMQKLEEWQGKQNGSLQRMEKKVDGIYTWLIGLMGCVITSLLLLVINLVIKR